MAAPKAKKQGPTAQETAADEVNQATWTDYKMRFRPAELEAIRRTEFTRGEKAQVKGGVAADTAAAFKGITRSTVASHNIAGANIQSGKTKLSMAGNATAAGSARGIGQGMAVSGGREDSNQQKARLAAFGRNISHEAIANMNRGAHRSTGVALAASQAKFERNMALQQGAATVAGAAFKRYQLNKERSKPFSDAEKARLKEAGMDVPTGFGLETDLGRRTLQTHQGNDMFGPMNNPFADIKFPTRSTRGY